MLLNTAQSLRRFGTAACSSPQHAMIFNAWIAYPYKGRSTPCRSSRHIHCRLAPVILHCFLSRILIVAATPINWDDLQFGRQHLPDADHLVTEQGIMQAAAMRWKWQDSTPCHDLHPPCRQDRTCTSTKPEATCRDRALG